ncbi:hypothetical protein, unlikely [Trypanosoma brucei gambiense DAL972]|uniref:Uncharacterized protein n=1 Tax=Trypanosoma brucei gambiense (strain MHOM/CI/86/DAL972) TaxID=679716 RepID=C9ZNW2_TRYB9|nr:hypothetical protein, unlikely [Trypanosoma brucei gambiense DAL972]CBH11090.1 hypothetical protein, unlikely [Trypanosoma brucei gambiense DAL972]|eukprot:XP_011773377.1 hypothetical protein, unlikely [Trypanosoma brucei gambiense DAL972]
MRAGKGGKKKTALNQPDDTKSLSASDTQRQYKRGFSLKKKKENKRKPTIMEFLSPLLSSPHPSLRLPGNAYWMGTILFFFSFFLFLTSSHPAAARHFFYFTAGVPHPLFTHQIPKQLPSPVR